MLRPVSQGQTRFTVPGLIADAQGVAFGPDGSILLPTISHLVGFLRSAGREQPLKLGLPNLQLFKARLVRGGPVVIAEFETRGRHGLDRASALARLHQGQLYTGQGRHRVRYRDAGAANGYDVAKLSTSGSPIRSLYDRPLPRELTQLEPLSFDKLVRQLSMSRDHLQRLSPEMFVRAPGTMMRRLVRHLATRGADVNVTMLDGDGVASETLISARNVPEGLWPLLEGMPRVRVYRREHPRIFVQKGWAHPLDLPGCASLLAGDDWLFFDAPNGVTVTPSTPRFARARDIVSPELATPPPDAVRSVKPDPIAANRYPLRLGKRVGAQGATKARLLRGPQAFAWLERLVYIAPTALLTGNRVAAWDDHVLVVGDDGGPPVPLGEPLREAAPNVFVPVDHGLSPRLPPRELGEMLAPTGLTVLLPDEGFHLPSGALRPLTRAVLSELPLADVLPVATDPASQTLVVPTEPGVFRRFWEKLR